MEAQMKTCWKCKGPFFSKWEDDETCEACLDTLVSELQASLDVSGDKK